jgi:TetR/AcrR family transcriptional regulator, tetracycline repressor protein
VQQHRRHTRSEVVDKAAELLDEYGIADLTMRRLARELGVTPGALYWHFADKQELLGAVADRILRAADVDVDGEWAVRMQLLGTRLRDALLSTTDGAELVAATLATGTSAALVAILARLTVAAADAGVDAYHTEVVSRTLVYFVLGFTTDEQSRLQWDAAGALPARESILEVDASARFAFGLRLLITGIAHAQAPLTRPVPSGPASSGAV